MKLTDRYSDQRLDRAGQLVLEKTTLSYSLVKRLLEPMDLSSSSNSTQEQAYLRGADYYDKKPKGRRASLKPSSETISRLLKV
ncbi:hypothetical protein P7E02_13375 [Enterococcus hulanensis]|uniref:hypothetical protein n=1 Tax=Enterococcus hulanensis TaxID=2559929 RepID=UPI00288F805B|nr:hypothetical protein [Enterococcus hulanensis]MDT2660868.1 hypothetical protein [Enterococcus hulanensis]